MKRRRLDKAELLPLPPAYQRKVQLRHHLALAALRSGRATPEQLALLLSTVQIAYLLRVPVTDDARADADLYRRAERALEQCYARLGDGAPIALRDDGRCDLELLVTAYDARLGRVPSHRYSDAQVELHHCVFSGRSPIPATAGTVAARRPCAEAAARIASRGEPAGSAVGAEARLAAHP